MQHLLNILVYELFDGYAGLLLPGPLGATLRRVTDGMSSMGLPIHGPSTAVWGPQFAAGCNWTAVPTDRISVRAQATRLDDQRDVDCCAHSLQ